MIENTIYDSRTLLGVFQDDVHMQPPLNYWLDLCFPSQIEFTTEEIDFSKVSDVRKLAPLVVPTAQGKPIYSAAERRTVVRPAYVKPKDPVTASRMIRRAPGIGDLGRQQPLTPQQRYMAIIADIQRQHRAAIERRWEWLAAQAIIEGKVVLEDEAYPRTVVDFERDPDHTIVLTNGNRWGDNGVSILRSIQSMTMMARNARFGGVINRMTIGADVWNVIWEDAEIREFLNTQFKSNAGIDLNLGIRQGLEVEFVGKLSNNLEVYVYSDYYQEPNGDVVPFMSPKDVVFTSPSVRGVRCFGAIADVGAQLQAMPVFSKMWNEQDPSATFVMNQSAPLMVPVNPNATIKATVVA